MTTVDTRRGFLCKSLYASAGLWVLGRAAPTATQMPGRPRRISPNERIQIAGIGAGGQGYWDIVSCGKHADIVAIADVDFGMAYKAFKAFPKARQYKDFRRMLAEMDRQIDAVTVSIPDHQHAVAAMMAIRMGKHVYVQKPLAHDIWEVRQLTEAARKHDVVTQLGNQGSANSRFRDAVEVVWSGAIGKIREVHVWSDRPFWPTGVKRPERVDPVPPTMDWDLWLGTAAERPYSRAYHPVKWRPWYDFGTGTLGDMGCHTANLPFMALKLAAPAAIEAEWCPDTTEDTYGTWNIVRYEFPARGELPPVKLIWYDGGTRMTPQIKTAIKQLMPGREVAPNGSVLIGNLGTMYSAGEYGQSYTLLPKEWFKDYQPSTPTLPRPRGEHHEEWLKACKGQGKTLSNFDYAGPLTEMVLLGCVALRARGRIEWDAVNLRITNNPKANDLLRREYRKGWAL